MTPCLSLWLFNIKKKKYTVLLRCVILKTFPIYRRSTPIPPEFPAPVTTGAGGCRTTPRPCCGALLLSGPNGLEFHRAPCGSPRFAGSAPLAGPENSHLPWQPGGKEREGRRKWRMTNEEEEDGVQKKMLTTMMSRRERITARKTERNMCSTALALIGKCLHSVPW